jgi:hypothetical protein
MHAPARVSLPATPVAVSPVGHASHSGARGASLKRPAAHCVHVVWLDSYFPAAQAEHDSLDPSAIVPSPHIVHDVTVPAVETAPAVHALFDVAPLDAGHWKPPGHAEHAALVATPAGS